MGERRSAVERPGERPGARSVEGGRARLALLAIVIVALIVALVAFLGDGTDDAPPRAADPETALAPDDLPETTPTPEPAVPEVAPRQPAEVPAEPEPPVEEATGDEDPRLRGQVLDVAGRFVPGARVVVLHHVSRELAVLDAEYVDTRTVVAETETDATGRFALELPADRPLGLTVTSPGHAPARRFPVHAGEDLVLWLDAASVLEGEVRRRADRTPVAGVRLRGTRGADVVLAGTTDALGQFRFEGLAPGTLTLTAEPDDLVSPGWIELDLEPGQVLRHVIEVDAGIVVRGRVTDAATGDPIEGATVGEGFVVRKSTRTDAEGRYELGGFGGPAYFGLQAWASGYGLQQHPIRLSDPRPDALEVDFALLAARRARGRVVDREGEPVAGVYVAAGAYAVADGAARFDWHATQSAGDGTFELADLRPDLNHAVFLHEPGFATTVYDFPTSERAAPVVELGDLPLARSASIVGQVVDEEIQPVTGIEVVLKGSNADRFRFSGGEPWASSFLDSRVEDRRTRTDSRGRFRFDDVAPGDHLVWCWFEGGVNVVDRAVHVEEGQGVAGIRLRIKLGLSIEGRVLGADGEGVRRALLRLYIEGESTRRKTLFSGSDGRFAFRGLEPARYAILVEPPPGKGLGEASFPDLGSGSRDVLLRLAPAAAVTGVVRTRAGAPAADAEVLARDRGGRLLARAVCDAEGRFTIELAEGTTVSLDARPAGAPLDDRQPALRGPARLDDVEIPSEGHVLVVE